MFPEWALRLGPPVKPAWSPPAHFANSGATIVQGFECRVKKSKFSTAGWDYALESDL